MMPDSLDRIFWTFDKMQRLLERYRKALQKLDPKAPKDADECDKYVKEITDEQSEG